ncbi:hypothetical protein ABPG75_007431 [Micractinium tetrahymenae]
MSSLVAISVHNLQARYQAYLTADMRDWDKLESFGWVVGTTLLFCWWWALGLVQSYPQLAVYWLVSQQAAASLPGLAVLLAPAFYTRHREPVIIASKLLAAALYPRFRLSWHSPGTPEDARAALGGRFLRARLPIHPLALAQTGTVAMLALSVRHSLCFKAQLLCQLALFFMVAQAEQLARRRSADQPRQHLTTPGQATMLQVVCGLVLPLSQHFLLDRQRRARWVERERRQAREQRGQRVPQDIWGQPLWSVG